MEDLKNKKVLFIAVKGYSDGIVKKMEELGIDVDYFNDKPNDGFICKACGRYRVKPYEIVLNNYYKKLIASVKNKKYDYVLMIKGEYAPYKSLERIRKAFKDSKMVLYLWDSLADDKGADKRWKYFDKVYTFDRIDYLNNVGLIEFLPLYYYEDCLPKNMEKADNYKYDIAFIGTGHEDRVKIVRNVEKWCINNGKNIYSYIYMPHLFVYLYNKVFNKNYAHVKKRDIKFKKLSFEQTYKMYSKSKCVIDIESSKQAGLTMRTIETVGLRKKLITTNKDIIHYDFYNPSNIMVVDRHDLKIDKEFFDKPYELLNDDIYYKYSLENWIKILLG